MPLGSPATKRPLERDCNGNMLFKSDRASVVKYSCSTVGSTARRLPSEKTARCGNEAKPLAVYRRRLCYEELHAA